MLDLRPFSLNSLRITSDRICFGDSLVIGDRPCGSGHNSLLDGVRRSVEEHIIREGLLLSEGKAVGDFAANSHHGIEINIKILM